MIAGSLSRADGSQPQCEGAVDPHQAACRQPPFESWRQPARYDGEVYHRGHCGHCHGVSNSQCGTGARAPALAPRVDARPQQRRCLVNHRPNPGVPKGRLIMLQRFVTPHPVAWRIQCGACGLVVFPASPDEDHAGEQSRRQTTGQGGGSYGVFFGRAGVRHGGPGDRG